MIAAPPPPLQLIVIKAAEDVSPEEQFTARARADGWSESQAAWIGRLGAAALPRILSAQPDRARAIDEAYRAGRWQLTIGYFDDALQRGKSRLVAFLTVADLERQIAERRGGVAPSYSDDALKAAYIALAHAAERGASSDAQLGAAFAVLRTGQTR